MRLIDATVFRRELDKHYPFTEEPQKRHGMADIAKDGVMRALACTPTVDAIPVVRCKDCKYWERYTKSLGYCKDLYGFGRWWRPDDFCSRGARKDGDGDGGKDND